MKAEVKFTNNFSMAIILDEEMTKMYLDLCMEVEESPYSLMEWTIKQMYDNAFEENKDE